MMLLRLQFPDIISMLTQRADNNTIFKCMSKSTVPDIHVILHYFLIKHPAKLLLLER